MEFIFLLIGLAIGVGAMGVVSHFRIKAQAAMWQSRIDSMAERVELQKQDFATLQNMARLEFEKVAADIFEDKSTRFNQSNQHNIEALLKPLGQSISSFRERVEQTLVEQTKQRSSLEAQVRLLVETSNRVGDEANNLASALKGNSKKMGNWGEMILESILEQSGLVRDREYSIQPTIEDAQTGRSLRPDVLVNLPDSRTVIIDSKVSLIAYENYCSSDDEQQQQLALKEHLRSIYAHIDSLASKGYDDLSTALDFTMLFVPIEPAYMLAIGNDKQLWNYAYSKRIVLISPTNLIACLKLMADLWKRELQSKSAQEIVSRGERMYEKFVGFVDNMDDLGRMLSRSKESYDKAFSQLATGPANLIRQAQQLKDLGLKSSKTLPHSQE